MRSTSKDYFPVKRQHGQALIECIIWLGLALTLWFGGVRAASTMLARIQAQGNVVVSARNKLDHLAPTTSQITARRDIQLGVSALVRDSHSIRIPKQSNYQWRKGK